MTSKTLSAVLEKNIQRLCLNDFPCGNGSWVSLIDHGLLKFSNLKELVLTANYISEVPAENLPSSLKVLELRANRLSALTRLTSRPPPHLHYLGLGSNSLGSHEDAPHLTGTFWPELVILDLGDCEFQEQRVLLEALSTLPRLKTLYLEGNPLTLAPCYPGLTVDRLPHLSYLDGSWISPNEKYGFQGLAKLSAVTVDQALATVKVGRVRGIPNPMTAVNENTSEFPVITYRYFITYEFISHQTPANLIYEFHSDVGAAAHESDASSSETDLQSKKNCDEEPRTLRVFTEETVPCPDTTHATVPSSISTSTHRTAKLPWSECMDFSDTQTYIVTDLGALKKFLKQGLTVRVEEEKVVSWPAVSEEVTIADSGPTVKGNKSKKGKESSVKSGSNKDKSKDKKKKSALELVQDPPIQRTLGSVDICLESLKKSGQKVEVVCGLGALHTEAEDMEKKIEESNQKEDSEKNAKRPKGEGKDKSKVDALTVMLTSVQLEPLTVEVSVELETWKSTSEARLWRPRRHSGSEQPAP